MATQQKYRFAVPKGTSKTDRRRIGLDVITFIQQQAINFNRGFNKNKGRFGLYVDFIDYTEKYAKKKGVGVGDVDLINKGNMFNAMEVLQVKEADHITVGFRLGTQNDKAEGNQKGTYGQRNPKKKKPRPFLGISKIELATIVKKVKVEGQTEKENVSEE